MIVDELLQLAKRDVAVVARHVAVVDDHQDLAAKALIDMLRTRGGRRRGRRDGGLLARVFDRVEMRDRLRHAVLTNFKIVSREPLNR